MPLIILSIIVQVVLVIHVVKTGRNTNWIWIVVMLPVAGSIAYFILEVLPGLMSGAGARKTKAKLRNSINPNESIKEAAHNLNIADTVANTLRLAQECLQKEQFADARDLFTKCLTGIHENDPDIMTGLAQAEFGLNNFSECKNLLDRLIEKNPDYKNSEAHLLYARSVESLGDVPQALEEYATLAGYYPGPEAGYRYALLLQQNGEHEKAGKVLDDLLHTAEISGKHYNSRHQHWINLAKKAKQGY